MIKDASTLGVGRVVELEAPIEAETVDNISAHPSPHGIRSLKDRDLHTVPAEMTSGSEAGQPGSHDDDGHGAQVSRGVE